MSDKKFNAILAKNNIAREVRDYLNSSSRSEDGSREPIFIKYIVHELKELESFLGEANQPSVADILSSDYSL